MPNIQCLGVMSGSSCDGLDLALCHFTSDGDSWQVNFIKGTTILLNNEIKKTITSNSLSASDLAKLDHMFGHFIGSEAKNWIESEGFTVDLISSHGHTMFHKPGEAYGFQIGSGAVIASVTGIDTVSDFRSADIALGGQGAPLVPIGDRLLYPEYDAWLNLGGISNISFRNDANMVAMDVGPCNMVLNHYAEQLGLPFDDQGENARKGQCNQEALDKLCALPYFDVLQAKSLGREWVFEDYIPTLDSFDLSTNDKLATVCSHLAFELLRIMKEYNINTGEKQMLVTGGGAFNSYLIELFRSSLAITIVIPDENTIQYKEAIIFALLGVKRKFRQINVLSSVTGSKMDHCAGRIDIGRV